MKQYYVRPAILSDLFTNLAAGWFALIIITPGVLINYLEFFTFVNIAKSLLGGLTCLLIAEIFSRLEVKS